MKTLLISLVSDQTLPNVQLIKELKGRVTNYLFISTEAMEKKGCRKWIERACNLNQLQILEHKIVNQFSFDDINRKLDEIDFSSFQQIIVNLTGGTKIITLSAYEYFKQLGADIYYVTGNGKEYIKIFPGRNRITKYFDQKITIKDYLSAYGFEPRQTDSSGISADYTEYIYERFLENGFLDHFNALIQLRKKRTSGIKDLSKASAEVHDFLSFIKFAPLSDNTLTSLEIKYLTGEWLEEFIGHKIKQELNLSDEELMIGVVLNKETPTQQVNSVSDFLGNESNKSPDNEIDVMFIYNNKFFTVECKTSIINIIESVDNQDGSKKIKEQNILGETSYKADYLKNRFGLFAQSRILTLTDFYQYVNAPEKEGERNNRKNNMEDLINRCNLSNIKLIDKKMVVNNINSLSSIII